jgi:hypothetical protein
MKKFFVFFVVFMGWHINADASECLTKTRPTDRLVSLAYMAEHLPSVNRAENGTYIYQGPKGINQTLRGANSTERKIVNQSITSTICGYCELGLAQIHLKNGRNVNDWDYLLQGDQGYVYVDFHGLVENFEALLRRIPNPSDIAFFEFLHVHPNYDLVATFKIGGRETVCPYGLSYGDLTGTDFYLNAFSTALRAVYGQSFHSIPFRMTATNYSLHTYSVLFSFH